MLTSRGWLRAATALAGLSAVLIPAAAPASANPAPAVRAPLSFQQRALPEPPPADVARKELGELSVEVDGDWSEISPAAR